MIIPWVFCFFYADSLKEQLDPSVKSLLSEKQQEVQDFLFLNKKSLMKDYIFLFVSPTGVLSNEDFFKNTKELTNHLAASDLISQSIFNIKDIRNFLKETEYLHIPIESYEILKSKAFNSANDLKVKDAKNNTINLVKSNLKDQYAKLKSQEIKESLFYNSDYLINHSKKQALIIIESAKPLSDMSTIQEFYKSINHLVDLKNRNLNIRYLGTSYSLLLEYETLWNGLKSSFILSLLLIFLVLLAFFRSVRVTLVTVFNLATSLLVAVSFFILSGLNVNVNVGYLIVVIAGSCINYAIAISFYYISSFEKNYMKVMKRCFSLFLLGAVSTSFIYLSLMASDLMLYRDFAIVGGIGSLITILSIFVVSYLTSFLLDDVVWSSFRDPKALIPFKNIKLVDKKKVALITLIVILCNIGLFSFFFLRSSDLIEKNSFQFRSDRYSMLNSKSFSHDLNNFSMKLTFVPVMTIVAPKENLNNLQRGMTNSRLFKSEISGFRAYTLNDFIPSHQSNKNLYIENLKKKYDLNEIYNSPYVDEWGEHIVSLIRGQEVYREYTKEKLPLTLKKVFSTKDPYLDVLFLNFNINEIEKDIFKVEKVINEIKTISKRLSNEKVYITGTLPILVRVYKKFTESILTVLSLILSLTLVILITFSCRYKLVFSSVIYLGMITFLFFGFIIVANIKLNILNFIAVVITIGIGIDYIINFHIGRTIRPEKRFSAYLMVILMSATTTISYFSIIITTDHKLMHSFALLCLMGEIITICSAILVALIRPAKIVKV